VHSNTGEFTEHKTFDEGIGKKSGIIVTQPWIHLTAGYFHGRSKPLDDYLSESFTQ
jgi:hypothetical protein